MALIEHLRERIRELEARLAKDSHNSSRPPSSDSPFKKPPPRSQRQPSGRKPGGQPDRRGVTRSPVDHPDQCVIIPLTGTCVCGRCGTGIAATVLVERRQVVEVEIHVRSLSIALSTEPVPMGTSNAARFLQGLRPRCNTARAYWPLRSTYADATGRCVNGNLYWLHGLSTDRLTACFPHPKCGAEALDAFGLLAPFAGVLVHDHWSACQRYPCWHAFCNAHHLRELTAIAERSPSQPWTTDMIALLCQANALVSEAQAQAHRTSRHCPPVSRALADPPRYHPHRSRSRQSSPSPPSWHPRASQTIPGLQPHSATAQTPQRGPALPHRPARSLR